MNRAARISMWQLARSSLGLAEQATRGCVLVFERRVAVGKLRQAGAWQRFPRRLICSGEAWQYLTGISRRSWHSLHGIDRDKDTVVEKWRLLI